MKRTITYVIFYFLCLSLSFGQLSLQDGVSNYLIDFDTGISGVNAGTFTGLGFSGEPFKWAAGCGCLGNKWDK